MSETDQKHVNRAKKIIIIHTGIYIFLTLLSVGALVLLYVGLRALSMFSGNAASGADAHIALFIFLIIIIIIISPGIALYKSWKAVKQGKLAISSRVNKIAFYYICCLFY